MTWIERENPAAPAQIVGAVPRTEPSAVDALARQAHEQFLDWSRRPMTERLAVLSEAAGALAARVPELAVLLARESGKPVADCRGELTFAVTYLRWVCANAPAVLVDSAIDDELGRLEIGAAPFGVVLAITPWNAPVILAMLKLGPALAAGNSVMLKPSPLAPLTVQAVAEMLPHTTVVHGGPETVLTLIDHKAVRKIAFTGGEAAGRSIAAAAGRALKPVLLELGGNDPAIFLDDFALSDSDYERLVLASFATSGQVCMAAKRLYVPRGRFTEFVDSYRAAAARVLTVGDPTDEAVTMGPMVSRSAADRVEGLLTDAAAHGGRLVTLADAPDSDGYFLSPTLVLDLPDDADLVRLEQFGPALPVLTYDTVDEVVDRANDSELGLGASVWSADEERAFAVAARVEAGFTFVNTHNRTGMSLRAPFGGTKDSGFGREYGEEGLRAYAQSAVRHLPAAFRAGGAGTAANAYPT
ncbi:aldehyde dehydrogenase family protein [Nocardia higoensis]|uniref:aldehyde dehydrogenase family protein n=1 Tax=Nocardia higoensis TaxID=228599 RepID=UPI0002E0D9F8|nr:aldehyde dehydrogenase family protein [Nocardia higoensis]